MSTRLEEKLWASLPEGWASGSTVCDTLADKTGYPKGSPGRQNDPGGTALGWLIDGKWVMHRLPENFPKTRAPTKRDFIYKKRPLDQVPIIRDLEKANAEIGRAVTAEEAKKNVEIDRRLRELGLIDQTPTPQQEAA